ncbi:F-box protein At3g44326-like [Henckelia pumila]|uniref:F-box protein At3g44326-like n=1 Tax=Henckelia pumila TaxID=405737 RepID=UPI003C6E6CF9
MFGIIIKKLFQHSKSNTTTADESGGGKHIPLLDGFRQLVCSCKYDDDDDEVWQKICNSMWPSTTDDPRVLGAISSFRSFYSDSFPGSAFSHRLPRQTFLSAETSSLISAVDIYYKDEVIYSKVLETETISETFFRNKFKVNLLGSGETTVPTPVKYNIDHGACQSLAEQNLRVSWIVIDPYNKRAINIASHKPVRSRYTEAYRIHLTTSMTTFTVDSKLKLYHSTVATLATGKQVQFAVKVNCGWTRRELHVKEVTVNILGIEPGNSQRKGEHGDSTDSNGRKQKLEN